MSVDPDEAQALQDEWDRRGIHVPLTVIDSPFAVAAGVGVLTAAWPARRAARLQVLRAIATT